MSTKRSIINSASEDRLDKLIQERLQAGANREVIDQRIWDLFGEEWCIMFTDLSGFSRGVAEFGIIHFLQTIHESERLLIPVIDDFDGILLKVEGDSFLVIFRKPEKALQAAIEMQHRMRDYNQNKNDTDKILLCVGLGYGRILKIGDTDVFGAEVNAASKLGEDIAKAYQILVTESVKDKVVDYNNVTFTPIDEIPPGAKAAYRVNYEL